MDGLTNPIFRNALMEGRPQRIPANVLAMTHMPPRPILGPAGQATANYLRDVVTGENLRQGLENYRNALLQTAQAGITGQPLPPEAEAALMDVFPGAGLAGITAFHGSPHLFEKFSLGKIGTGEGAQAYGHGLYFAESPETAKFYQAKLSGNLGQPLPIRFDLEGSAFSKDYGKYLKNGQEISKEKYGKAYQSALNEFASRGKGHIYKVDIPDKYINNFLDWDKPLSEQPETVQKALEPIRKQIRKSFPEYADNPDITGEGIYQLYRQHRGGTAEFASEGLNEAGIKGIRYLDQGSRAAGEGSRNFVVFDDKIIQMLERNNEPVINALRPQAGFSPEIEAQIAREAKQKTKAGNIPAMFKAQAE